MGSIQMLPKFYNAALTFEAFFLTTPPLQYSITPILRRSDLNHGYIRIALSGISLHLSRGKPRCDCGDGCGRRTIRFSFCCGSDFSDGAF